MKNRPPLSVTRRCARAFVLLEVILSLAIFGFAAAALMRSFAQSMAASRTMEIKTQALFLAEQVMHHFELEPPNESKDGGFGDAYRNYSYHVEVRYADPRYRKMRKMTDIEQMFAMREVTIEIRYNDGQRKNFVPLRIETAVTGFEKYTMESKRSYKNY